MFWDNYITLCEKDNKSPNKVAAEIGCSSGSVTAWKQGRLPRKSTLVQIAEYFNVTVDELLGNKPAQNSDITFDDFTYALHNETKDLTDEQKQSLLDMARIFKQALEKEDKRE